MAALVAVVMLAGVLATRLMGSAEPAPARPAASSVAAAATGTTSQASRTSATTLPGLAWRRVIVAHTVTAAADLDLQVTADGVPAGDALLVDEVIVRQG